MEIERSTPEKRMGSESVEDLEYEVRIPEWTVWSTVPAGAVWRDFLAQDLRGRVEHVVDEIAFKDLRFASNADGEPVTVTERDGRLLVTGSPSDPARTADAEPVIESAPTRMPPLTAVFFDSAGLPDDEQEVGSITFADYILGEEDDAWATPERIAARIWNAEHALDDLVLMGGTIALVRYGSDRPRRGGPDSDDPVFAPVRAALEAITDSRISTDGYIDTSPVPLDPWPWQP